MAKVTIECVDCGASREITKACLNLVKRCKSCQKIFNRDRARNRYRSKKGIPLDKPVQQMIQPKSEIEEEEKPEAPSLASRDSIESRLSFFNRHPWHGLGVEFERWRIENLQKERTPEEEKRVEEAMKKLIEEQGWDDDDSSWI